eukprot:gb/GECG01006747.1/.p1 GENE.gb/GECG01006747.1/~~gb/GECG01006747.1/.p1  ORF type:complete len:181 (+),score=9.40 gb/GECG01006747.1/:1-543(+)
MLDVSLLYIVRCVLSPRQFAKVRIFTSLFYPCIIGGTDADACRHLQRDDLSKEVAIIPIYHAMHFSLVVLFPNKLGDPSAPMPMLFLDSKMLHPVEAIGYRLSHLYKMKWREAHDILSEELPLIAYHRIDVPQQGNGIDCGIFVVRFVEAVLHRFKENRLEEVIAEPKLNISVNVPNTRE